MPTPGREHLPVLRHAQCRGHPGRIIWIPFSSLKASPGSKLGGLDVWAKDSESETPHRVWALGLAKRTPCFSEHDGRPLRWCFAPMSACSASKCGNKQSGKHQGFPVWAPRMEQVGYYLGSSPKAHSIPRGLGHHGCFGELLGRHSPVACILGAKHPACFNWPQEYQKSNRKTKFATPY